MACASATRAECKSTLSIQSKPGRVARKQGAVLTAAEAARVSVGMIAGDHVRIRLMRIDIGHAAGLRIIDFRHDQNLSRT